LRIGVILASLGRPAELGHVLDHLSTQTEPPSVVVLSLEKLEDAPAQMPSGVKVVLGSRGLCAQRNRALDIIVDECDVVVFYDDDYVPSKNSIKGVSELFERHPDVVGATGKVLADGITSGGIDYSEAHRIVEEFDARPIHRQECPHVADIATAYGCNMAFRTTAVANLRFDERLPLYGWQEDVDFAGRVRKLGRMVATDAFVGVHCGTYRSRMAGQRTGFSQIVNPIYLMRKGSMRPQHALTLIAKNVIANHVKMIRPEWYVDRKGRARGNWLGIYHILSGRADPMAVLEIEP